jgi:hypothetical protein
MDRGGTQGRFPGPSAEEENRMDGLASKRRPHRAARMLSVEARARHRRALAEIVRGYVMRCSEDLLLLSQQVDVLGAFKAERIQDFLVAELAPEIGKALVAALVHPSLELAEHGR